MATKTMAVQISEELLLAINNHPLLSMFNRNQLVQGMLGCVVNDLSQSTMKAIAKNVYDFQQSQLLDMTSDGKQLKLPETKSIDVKVNKDDHKPTKSQ